ncbi:GltB/FmdC/FwdC-like GXGXG domain-containing protein [Roseiconus lacunae]|uniref:Tributyrin esterase n=1 Tax=Roseiconus lacunae TaxID=2605694 RepID=A0ABT7PPY7_9BACT|nr:tributyrin esterase [Roseiconus lacunae]MCD0462521.1 tributyrin esterase [Roseiconus lacunae]MDM4018413.1 tributyrin esterase [Roseiconus lacunae]WRQ49281.1 tributyrin esterase [Stieleria sp. HD01]
MPHIPKPSGPKPVLKSALDTEVEVKSDTEAVFDSESRDLMSPEGLRFSMARLTDAELRAAVHVIPLNDQEDKLPRVEIDDADGQHAALMRLNHPIKLRVNGSLGDYAFAHHRQVIVKVFGNVGHGVGEGMASGSVRIRGNAGHGAGTAMTGGTLAIYGSAGDRAGAAMRGGGLFVRGHVGNEVGLGAIGGTIVIGGDAGENLGDPLSDVAVFIRGKAASLADGVTQTKLRKKQEVQLGLLLISAGIRGDASDFQRIVPIAKLEAERAARGEVVPNWR